MSINYSDYVKAHKKIAPLTSRIIARTIMNKVAKLIEKILGLSLGKGHRVSFTDHKKRLPVNHPNIHPVYLDYLTNRTHWYEQELLLLRDNIFIHGNTFITP